MCVVVVEYHRMIAVEEQNAFGINGSVLMRSVLMTIHHCRDGGSSRPEMAVLSIYLLRW